MISRRSTILIADSYVSHFSNFYLDGSRHGRIRKVNIDKLYEYLFLHEFQAWFLAIIKKVQIYPTQKLKETIMGLHTGEVLLKNLPQLPPLDREKLGQDLLLQLAESLLLDRYLDIDFEQHTDVDTKLVDQMQLALELDGYIFRSKKLFQSEETVVNETNEQDILESLIISVGLQNIEMIKHHLELSAEDYQEGRWSDSIANSRKVFEAVLAQISIRFSQISGGKVLSSSELKTAAKVRDNLKTNGFFDGQEKDALAKIYGLLSETGGHPYIASRDEARLMRHLLLTICQFELLRLEGIINQ